jgi:hypothetical protein
MGLPIILTVVDILLNTSVQKEPYCVLYTLFFPTKSFRLMYCGSYTVQLAMIPWTGWSFENKAKAESTGVDLSKLSSNHLSFCKVVGYLA